MIPYGSFTFFFILILLLAPTVILGLKGKRIQSYNMFVSVVFLALIFSQSVSGFLSLCFFTIWQVLLIQGYIAYRKKGNRFSIFFLTVVFSILPLILSKIVPFFMQENWIGFLGISYLTFKGVQLIMETRDGLIKQTLPISRLLYFILFFPTISSGPIDRYRRFEKDLNTQFTKEQYKELLYLGINKIFLGFFYKYILGYLINHHVISNLPLMTISKVQEHLIYLYSYSLYLFFDFAGYSAFAIGVSYIMGVKTPENFNKPFLSQNIKDFWNRWHMSLSFWFRDYVFMRFVFWMTKKKWITNRMAVSNLGYLLLFILMGLWHGLAIQYVVYGLYHAALMIGYNFFEKINKKHKWWPKNTFTRVISIIITFHFICFGFYIFSGQLNHFMLKGIGIYGISK